ncbi:MAG: peptidylprolyl isomerase [Pseudogulbenkiania sp.]|nr:peptidylprolyl isomerase [Pseudogulbenkiania sp.]
MQEETITTPPDALADADAGALHEIRERLQHRCVVEGRLAAGAAKDTVDEAIERLLAEAIVVANPSEVEMRRYFDSHRARFRAGEAIAARHILYQVTSRTPVPALRTLAETHLGELLQEPSHFSDYARRYSNCPSAQLDGQLGQLNHGDVVPELERVLFTKPVVGLLHHIVPTRFGFHIVAIDHYFAGRELSFEEARPEVETRLRQQLYVNALIHYVRNLDSDSV